MTLHLTPECLEAAYEYLRTTKPFCNWNLPEGEDVKFIVSKSRDEIGHHKIKDSVDIISASQYHIGRTLSLMELMAHEMLHVHQRAVGTETPGVKHNRAFNLLAARVCKAHGFDPKTF